MELEIWSDVACPWCYVGKRRLEAALAQFEHRDQVRITWRSFELDPEAPAERPGDRTEHLARKYGITVERARELEGALAQTAAGDGLEMHFDQVRAANSYDAHRLVHLAQVHGRQAEMKERLLRAYFTEGELISDSDTLARLAGEVGLPAEEVAATLGSDRYGEEVRMDEATAGALGISAVPMFVVDRALGASGAHPPEALLELLQRGWQERGANGGAGTAGSDAGAAGGGASAAGPGAGAAD